MITIDWSQILHLLVEKKPPSMPLRFKQIHALFLTTGLALHSQPFSRLLLLSSHPSLSSYLDGGISYSSSLLLRSPRPPSTFLSNTLTSSLASSGHPLLALSLYSLLLLHSTSCNSPNPHTYPSLLKACSFSPSLLPLGLALHAHLLKILPLPLEPFVLTSLLILHSRRGRRDACRRLFDQILNPDLPAWNAVLSSYTRWSAEDCSVAEEVLSLFQRLQLSSVSASPNEITLGALIGACGNLGALSLGIWGHAYICRSRSFVVNRFVGAALIEMYSKCGRLDFAYQVFAALPVKEKDTFCYNAMMRGHATHGEGHGVLALFEEMRREGIQPNDVSLVVTMSACAHAGLVEEGRQYFERMTEEFGILPKVEHYGCLIDLLGRAGRLEEAEQVLWNLPVELNAMLYRTLLGACRIYSSLQIEKKAIAHLIQLEPRHGVNYVLLSNIYADIGQWDDAVRMRKAMKERGIDKLPGLSQVEIDGFVHEFVMGDQTHPQTMEIYAMLDEISMRFNECGLRPQKSLI